MAIKLHADGFFPDEALTLLLPLRWALAAGTGASIMQELSRKTNAVPI